VAATISEKILARAAGLEAVRPGDHIRAKPHVVLAYDFPGVLDVMFRQMKEELGVDELREPGRFALFIDHMVPAAAPSEEEIHEITRRWAREHGVALHERAGIGHQVAAERGYALPGTFVVHFDRHVSALGAFGCLAMGIRRQILEAFVDETIGMEVPGSVKVDLHGALGPGVMARDLYNHLIAKLGPEGCRGQVLELTGPTVEAMSLEGRMTMCGLASFTGAVSAIVNPDAKAIAWVRARTDRAVEILSSDDAAGYAAVHRFEVSAVEPYIVLPPSPAAVVPVSAKEGAPVDQGYIGSCVSGRLEDLRAAAHVLRGRRVKADFRLNVVPTSNELMLAAMREGLLDVLVEAGAFISSPTCDYCYGHIQALAPGQRAVSTGTLNVPGRMGSVRAEIYIASAATVAATAVEGRLADPRKYF